MPQKPRGSSSRGRRPDELPLEPDLRLGAGEYDGSQLGNKVGALESRVNEQQRELDEVRRGLSEQQRRLDEHQRRLDEVQPKLDKHLTRQETLDEITNKRTEGRHFWITVIVAVVAGLVGAGATLLAAKLAGH
jgi:uncharacterized coiled-coil protein SlyX